MYLFDIFVTRIAKDFKQKELLPLKVLFFVHASTLFVLYPYLTIHMRELGINVEETAIMSAVTPIVAIVMPPIAGMVADRIGNFKILLAIFSSLGGGASLLLLLVPVGRITITYPEKVIFDIGCGDLPHVGVDRILDLNFADDQPCDFVPSLMQSKTYQVNSTLEACGFVCKPKVNSEVIPGPTTMFQENVNNRNMSNLILKAHRYDVIVINPLNSNVTESYSYILTALQNPDILSKTSGDNDLRNHRIKKNKEFYQTSVRMSANNSYFFPTTGLYNLACVPINETHAQDENDRHNSIVYNCTFGKGTSLRDGVSQMHFLREMFLMNMFHLTSSNTEKTFLVPGLNKRTFKESERNATKVFNASCNDVYTQNGYKISISVQLHDPEKSTEVDRIVQLSECRPRCLVTIPRSEICSNLKVEEVYNMRLTFWSYLAVRVFIGMIGGTAFAMFEGAVIAILREQNADYGLQRIYATIGGMISSPLSGLLIDYASQGKGYSDFRPAFYLYATLKILSGFLMLTINLEFKPAAKNVVSDVYSVLKNVELVALFIAIFVLGTAWGYIESFLFWLLQDLGGTRTLMGFTITVSGLAGIPLLILSGPIIDKIGHANVLFIGFIFYAMRLVGYSLIYNPWLCLIFEAMECVTSSLSFTAAVTYAAKLSTTTTDSSIQGLLGGIYFGVGKGAGSLIGGYTMKAFGTRPTYRIFAVACTITGLVYFIFNKFYLLKQPQVEGNDIIKKTDSSKPKEKKKIDAADNGKEKEIIEMHVNNNFNAPSATRTDLESSNSSSVNIENSEKPTESNENHISEDLRKRDNAQSRSVDGEENKEELKTSTENSSR